MLVLLPPSEGKSAPRSGPPLELSGLSPRQAGDVAGNAALLREPARSAAIRRDPLAGDGFGAPPR